MLKVIAEKANKNGLETIQEQIEKLEKIGKVKYIDSTTMETTLVVFIGFTPYSKKE